MSATSKYNPARFPKKDGAINDPASQPNVKYQTGETAETLYPKIVKDARRKIKGDK